MLTPPLNISLSALTFVLAHSTGRVGPNRSDVIRVGATLARKVELCACSSGTAVD